MLLNPMLLVINPFQSILYMPLEKQVSNIIGDRLAGGDAPVFALTAIDSTPPFRNVNGIGELPAIQLLSASAIVQNR
jgi:hypothetical protein